MSGFLFDTESRSFTLVKKQMHQVSCETGATQRKFNVSTSNSLKSFQSIHLIVLIFVFMCVLISVCVCVCVCVCSADRLLLPVHRV